MPGGNAFLDTCMAPPFYSGNFVIMAENWSHDEAVIPDTAD